MIGEPNRYVKAGSRVVIRCVIRGALEPPSYVIWYWGAEQLFADNHFGWEMRTDEGDSQSTVSCGPCTAGDDDFRQRRVREIH